MNSKDSFYLAQLKKDRKGFWAKYLNLETWISRPLASLLVRLVFRSRITPNHLTLIAFLLALGSTVLFALGTAMGAIGAAVLCQLLLIFDCADGMLARARGTCSRFGSFLDLFLDRISDFLVILGITIGFFRSGGGDKDRLILGLFILALYMLQVVLYYISNSFLEARNGESGEGRAVGIFYITVMGILNRLDLILYGLAVEVTVNLVFRVTSFLRSGRRAENRLPIH
ncbi:MAG: CDP-alcohol phosphatidyltransferase family protein [Acidobacteria bacterium]|jgi:phosphatidylglycerophosphate synthase|nr:CDP-alcohol phosphatidyltransferase family protein [Acidobacteriota bacterium]